MAASVSFRSTLKATGDNTGIVVPSDALETLGAGKRPAVMVDVNGYAYATTVGAMGSESLIPVSAAIRKATGLAGGDAIHVTITLATAPRDVHMPDDFAAALNGVPATRAFFEALSNSLQRFHVDNINGAKSAETRQRRIDKAIELFRNGKQR
jgi:hypothetical protein